ncbi:MAG: hypothetical protein PVI90_13935 [Desulfobacteraceae bacterium]
MAKLKALLKSKKISLWLTALLLPIIFDTAAHGAVADYVGTYYGTFNGNHAETWHALIMDTGEVIFVTSLFDSITYPDNVVVYENYEVDGGTLSVDEEGHISGRTDILGWQIEATMIIENNNLYIQGNYESNDASGPLFGMQLQMHPNVAGDYSGDLLSSEYNPIGTWTVTVDSLGYATGTMSFSEGEAVNLYGVAVTNDYNPISFKVYNTSGLGLDGAYLTEYEDDDPIKGWWCNNNLAGEYGFVLGRYDSGPLNTDTDTETTTNTETDTNDDGGGGSGGGCFIKTIGF